MFPLLRNEEPWRYRTRSGKNGSAKVAGQIGIARSNDDPGGAAQRGCLVVQNDDGGYDSGGIVAEGSPAPWGPSLMASAQRLDEAPSSPLIAAFGRR